MTETERFRKQLDFILELDKEKNIFRQTHLTDGGRNAASTKQGSPGRTGKAV